MAPLLSTGICLALLGLTAAAGPYGSSRPSSSYGAPSYGTSYSAPVHSSGYGAPKSSSGYGISKPSSGYGVPKPSSGYGVPKPSSGYGVPKPSGGYGVPKPSSGYGISKPSIGYGVAESSSGYGVPKSSGGYGIPKHSSGYGAPKASSGFGVSKLSSGFGSSRVHPGASIGGFPSSSSHLSGRPAPFASSGPSHGFPGQRVQGGPSHGFPGQRVQGGGKFYYMSWENAQHRGGEYTWLEADQACRSLGYRLVSLTTPQKEREISARLGSVPFYWTSGRLRGNRFVWGDRSSTPVCYRGEQCYQNWSLTGGDNRPQPDNREGREECLSVLNKFYPGEGIVWHDIGCEHRKPFVCEN